jgi:hypothetical protein
VGCVVSEGGFESACVVVPVSAKLHYSLVLLHSLLVLSDGVQDDSKMKPYDCIFWVHSNRLATVCNGPLDLPCRTEYPAHIVIGHCALGVGQKQLVEPQHGIAEPPRGKTAVSDTEVGLGTGVELHHLLGTFDRLVELFFFAEEGAHQFEGCEIVGVYPQHALVAADGLVIVAILDQYEGDVEVYGGVA